MENLIIKILGVCALIFSGLCFVPSCREYFISNYQSLFWTMLFAFIATFVGVLLAFNLENHRQRQVEEDVFKYKLVALLFETSQNLNNIKDFRTGFNQAGVNIKQLNSNIAEQILQDPLTFKYGARGLMFGTQTMVNAIDTFNKNSEFVCNQFYQTPKNSDVNLKLIKDSIDQAEYRIRVVQKILDFYNVEKFKIRIQQEPNYDYIWELIKGNIDYAVELEKLRKENDSNKAKN